MDEMDLKIVAACNELIGTKSKTLNQRVDHTNERARLRRELDQQKRQLDKRLASLRLTKDLSVYREACTTVFEEAGIRIPGLAAARQAQLCLHVHILTVLDNQHELLKKQGHRERAALEVQANRVRDSIATCEIHYLNQMVQLEQQLQELQEWIQTTESTKTMASKRNKLNSSAHEKQEQEHEDQTASDQDTSKPGQEPLHSSSHDRPLNTADCSESDERTAPSTPPPPSLSSDGPRPTTERRGSVGMKGSCIMPARPQYLMMGPSKQSVAASTTTASSTIPSLAATPTVQLMHHPDDDDDDEEENDHTQIHDQKDISSSLSSSLPSYETTTTTSHNENGPPAIVAT